ncbi:hypothetical protein ACFWMR_19245 [Amycolatopsis thailandensis]|uniref:hypothetical protein n=1 Tax=Amycolatopsis thailandensis TaxID=589330 RepID=UPI0036470E8D
MGVRRGVVGRFAVVVERWAVVRVVSGVSWVVVVDGVAGGDGVEVVKGPVATVFGAVVVGAGTTLPAPDPPPAHAPSSTLAPTTRPKHHARMAGTLTAAASPTGRYRRIDLRWDVRPAALEGVMPADLRATLRPGTSIPDEADQAVHPDWPENEVWGRVAGFGGADPRPTPRKTEDLPADPADQRSSPGPVM